jgi:O-antigen ligase
MATLGLAAFCALLARYGLRGVLDTTKPWRFGAFCFVVVGSVSGGFRSALVLCLMTFALLFYLERLHHTRLLLPVLLVSLVGGGMMILFATRLPLSFQRSLAVLPFVQIDPLARMSADTSSEWRLQIWREMMPQIPQYLLVGRGYAFSGTEQAQMGKNDIETTELSGDYHNGPLSTILTFGLFGSIAFIWLLVAGMRVLYQNYQFGDPAYHHMNTFLFAYFIVKVVFFFTVFGGFHSDLPMFLGMLGLSISLNGGVAKPVIVPRPKIVFNRFKLHPSVRRPAGA